MGDEPGLGPAAEVLFFRQKDPKPCWPCHGPSGALRGSPTPAASKLAALIHCSPSLRCRLHGSAMPPGQGVLKKEKDSTQRFCSSRRINNGCALRDAPFIVPPRPATFYCADACNGGVAQLAGLRQGPPIFGSASPIGRPAGEGLREKEGLNGREERLKRMMK